MKKLYVGNLAYASTEESLRAFFEAFCPVVSCKIIRDQQTRQSRGFGFVEIEDDAKADEAIEALNGQTLDGKQLRINEARPKEGGFGGGGGGPRGGGGDRRGGYGGGGGYGGPRGGGGGDRRGGGGGGRFR